MKAKVTKKMLKDIRAKWVNLGMYGLKPCWLRVYGLTK